MGKAKIIENIGEGFYRIQLLYDQVRLRTELAQLKDLETQYYKLLQKVLLTLIDLDNELIRTGDALDAVIDQYRQGLLSKLNELPPPIPPPTPNDPETNEPWTDPDRSQDDPLAAAMNAARVANGKSALQRNQSLDLSVRLHLAYLASYGSTSIFGLDQTTPANRARAANYAYDAATGVQMLLGFGDRDPIQVVQRWLRHYTSERTWLLSDAFTEMGVGFRYAASSPFTYLWGAVLTKPGSPPLTEEYEDPAKKAAIDMEKNLKEMKTPAGDFPKKLAEASGAYAKVVQKKKAALEEIKKLKLDRLEWENRIALLEDLKKKGEKVYYAWCCQYLDIFPKDYIVQTAEIPGFWNDEGKPRYINLSDGRTILYDEYPINILSGYDNSGFLTWTENMTPAATFYATAIEPGHLKWNPRWRYGTILEKTDQTCTVLLDQSTERKLSREIALDLDDGNALYEVPFAYPPCNGAVFHVDDEVVIRFAGKNRTQPQVIGFRRKPIQCPQGRMTWRSLQFGR